MKVFLIWFVSYINTVAIDYTDCLLDIEAMSLNSLFPLWLLILMTESVWPSSSHLQPQSDIQSIIPQCLPMAPNQHSALIWFISQSLNSLSPKSSTQYCSPHVKLVLIKSTLQYVFRTPRKISSLCFKQLYIIFLRKM